VAWLLDHASEAGGHDLAMIERQLAKTSPAPRSAAGWRSGISLARTSVHRATEWPFPRARSSIGETAGSFRPGCYRGTRLDEASARGFAARWPGTVASAEVFYAWWHVSAAVHVLRA
jgi:hypothetical protein